MTDWPEGTGRFILPETDSTNAEAERRISGGAALPFWVLAHRQTAGKGRRGRAWLGAEGNFFATHAIATEGSAAEAALRSFSAALALHDALETVAAVGPRLSLKWPNDVLLDGRKLAGILLECDGTAGDLRLRIGIGVNLAAAPGGDELEPGALAPTALAVRVSPETLLDSLAPAFDHWEARLRSEGFEAIRTTWLARAARLGQTITARLPGTSHTGRFETVDPSGALVLETEAGALHLAAAEVHF